MINGVSINGVRKECAVMNELASEQGIEGLDNLLARVTLYDLSQPLYSGSPGWALYPPVGLEPFCEIQTDGYKAERLELITHSGTHLDVPSHFIADGKRLEEVPVGEFQGPAAVLDLRFLQPSQAVGAAELKPFRERIRQGDIVVLCTGWGDKRSHDSLFMYEWPYLTEEGAQWLVERGARAVAIDALSVGGWPELTRRPPHVTLLSAGCWILEDIRCPPEVVQAGRCHLFAFPVLLQGCGGSLVRAVAAVAK